MRATSRKAFYSVLFLAGGIGLGWAVNNAYIGFYGPYNVTGDPAFTIQWEPSSVSPTQAGSTWVHAFNKISPFGVFTAAWNPNTGKWEQSPSAITAPGSGNVGDAFVAYDPYHNGGQYLLVTTGLEEFSSSAYFATSTDGKNWTTLQPVLCGANLQGTCAPGVGAMDYSSIAVDSTGRIIVGAVLYQDNQNTSQTWGYYVNTSSDGGAHWSGATQVIAPPGPQVSMGNADVNRWGINGRVVAAGNHFYVFLPALESGFQFQPLAVYYYIENNGVWSGPTLVMDFSSAPPQNNSPGNPPTTPYIYYAPLIDASGNPSGTWAVTFQVKSGGGGQFNNVYACIPFGCYAVNPFAGDEFMNAASVDLLGGAWISYLVFPATPQNPYALPLYHQAIYLPPGGGALGTTGDMQVSPYSWWYINSNDRCVVSCYAMGDYARIGSNGGSPSNGSLGLDAPYVKYDSNNIGQLFQLFYYDPQGPPPPRNTFNPQPVFYPLGTTLHISAQPNVAALAGVPPEKRRKMPGFNK